MVPELEKPRVTEIMVRMDCNGCVQKIKKALHGINGIYDLYIDFPQQKLTVIGWADPEKIVKAIRKTRKTAIICSHSEPTEQPPAQQPEQPSEANQPPPEAANAPQTEQPQSEAQPPPQPNQATPPSEPPKDQQPPPAAENLPEAPAAAAAADPNASQTQKPHSSGGKDVGEVHVIYHHPPDDGYRYSYGPGPSYGPDLSYGPGPSCGAGPSYGPGPSYGAGPSCGPGPGLSYGPSPSYGGHWNRYASQQNFLPEQPQPAAYVTHSYNTYKPSPYVTEYEYTHSPPRYTNYSRMDHYTEDYHQHNSRGNGNITSIFSDENPNACRVM